MTRRSYGNPRVMQIGGLVALLLALSACTPRPTPRQSCPTTAGGQRGTVRLRHGVACATIAGPCIPTAQTRIPARTRRARTRHPGRRGRVTDESGRVRFQRRHDAGSATEGAGSRQLHRNAGCTRSRPELGLPVPPGRRGDAGPLHLRQALRRRRGRRPRRGASTAVR